MDDERQTPNPAGLAFNHSLVTGGVFNVYLPSQGKVSCHSEMNLADGGPENFIGGIATGAEFSGLNRARGRLSHWQQFRTLSEFQ